MLKKYKINNIEFYDLFNDEFSITIVPEIGSLISSIKYLPENFEFLYRHYKPLLKLEYVREGLQVDDLLNLMFTGGYFEVLPNAGYITEINGLKFGLHDETPYLPWTVINHKEDKIELECILLKYPIKVNKTIELKKNIILLKESIENLSEERLYFSWLHHPTFGANILSKETILEINADELMVDDSLGITSSYLMNGYKGKWPYAKSKKGEYIDLSKYPEKNTINNNDLIYITKLKDGYFLLKNKNKEIKFYWDKQTFPYLWIWRPIGGGPGYPWYGTIYATSIEITTSFPATGLKDQVKLGTAKILDKKEKIETEIKIEILA